MNLQFDEDLVEAAVFLWTRQRPGPAPQQVTRFQRARERLYSILDPEERNTAFFRLHLEWFREWGMEQCLLDSVGEVPQLPGGLWALVFRKARHPREEGSELYVNEAGERRGLILLRPERFQYLEGLSAFLRHELMHLQDMIDPGFGYQPQLELPGASVNKRRLGQERYRILWAISIDARLEQAGHKPLLNRAAHEKELARAFPIWDASKRQCVFQELWNQPQCTHAQLEYLIRESLAFDASPGARPGAHCPLCGFPTFSWAETAAVSVAENAAILAEFPTWTSEQGLCKRCHSIYRLKSAQAPAIV